MATFEVVPIWLNHTFPVVLPHLKVFCQKLLHKVRWMCWRVIVVKKPVTAWPKTRSFYSHDFTQTFHKFNVIFFVDRLTSWNKFVVHNTLTTRCFCQRRSARTRVTVNNWAAIFKPPVPFLYLCYDHIFAPKAYCIISIVSVQLLPTLKQNLMQIRWSVLSVIFNIKQMRRTENTLWT